MNKKDKDEQIALFRYGIISSVFYKGEDSQIDYFKRISKKVHDVPYLGKKRYKVGTYKSWLRKYRKGGFKAIKPKTRSDKGASRKINEALGAVIKETIEELPSLSDSGIYRILSSKKEMMSIDIHEGTLRKYIRDNNLRVCVCLEVWATLVIENITCAILIIVQKLAAVWIVIIYLH